MSGGTGWRRPSCTTLFRMLNAPFPAGAQGALRTRSIRASGGASASRPRRKSASSEAPPSISISTAPDSFRTQPPSPWRIASRCTKGRKPTPCTCPVTSTRSAVTPGRMP